MTRELREYHHSRQYLNRNELEYEYGQVVQQLFLVVYVVELEQLAQLQLGFAEPLLVQASLENVASRIQLHSFCQQSELVSLLRLLQPVLETELFVALLIAVDKLQLLLELAVLLLLLHGTGVAHTHELRLAFVRTLLLGFHQVLLETWGC